MSLGWLHFRACLGAVAVIAVAGLQAIGQESLLTALDLDRPGLETCRSAWLDGRLIEAEDALLAYFAQRPPLAGQDRWLPPFTAREGAVARAEGILEDRIELVGLVGAFRRTENGNLDWSDRGSKDDPEWSWALNRHTYFEDLFLAWEATGDQRFLERLSADLVDWTEHNPYPNRLTFDSAWRPLEVARRILNSWTHIFLALQDEAAFSREARLALLASLPLHADALANHGSFWGGNHQLTETTALGTIAICWPEFRQAPAWKELALNRYSEVLQAQTYPDGAYKELSNHYHKVVWRGAERFLALFTTNDWDREAPVLVDLWDTVESLRMYFSEVMRPDGRGPLNNASDREDNRWHLRELGFDESPSARMHYFPWAGQAVMRDSLNDGDQWAFFDMGPYGSGHQHADVLSLELWLDGRPFLADGGRYSYKPGRWSAYFKGPRAHNVVLLDGVATLPGPRVVSEPLRNHVEIGDDYGVFVGKAAFRSPLGAMRSPANHSRALIYFPGNGWLIFDAVAATGSHLWESWWNFAPGVSREVAGRGLRLLTFCDARQTPLVPVVKFHEGSTAPISGWHSEQFGQKVPALARIHRQDIRGASLAAWMIVGEDTGMSVETASADGRGWSGVVALSSGRRYLVSVRAEPSDLHVELEEIR